MTAEASIARPSATSAHWSTDMRRVTDGVGAMRDNVSWVLAAPAMVAQGPRKRKRAANRPLPFALLQTAPVSSRGVAFTALVVAGGLAAVPACAFAQEPVASAVPPPPPAAPAAAAPAVAEPAAAAPSDPEPAPVPVAEPAVSGCPPREDEDELRPGTPEDPAPPPPAAAAAQDGQSDGPVAHCSQTPATTSTAIRSRTALHRRARAARTAPRPPTRHSAVRHRTRRPSWRTARRTPRPQRSRGSGNGLPNTGLGLGGLVALGLPLLAGGLALRRRIA